MPYAQYPISGCNNISVAPQHIPNIHTETMSNESEQLAKVVARLKKTFLTGKTRSLEWRLGQLHALKKMISENEVPCKEALAKDLGRGDFESFALELLPSILEIDHCLKHLSTWMQVVCSCNSIVGA